MDGPKGRALTMLEQLKALVGTWTGDGVATYPTMEDTPYTERLSFQLNDGATYLQYEQKTRRTETNAQSHWEFGFLRILDDGSVEMANVQSGGRVEVLVGEVHAGGDETKLVLTSTHFGNDPRMVAARREFTVSEGQLHYDQVMTTQTTTASTRHLKATLTKE